VSPLKDFATTCVNLHRIKYIFYIHTTTCIWFGMHLGT